jgi:hypothetical protein
MASADTTDGLRSSEAAAVTALLVQRDKLGIDDGGGYAGNGSSSRGDYSSAIADEVYYEYVETYIVVFLLTVLAVVGACGNVIVLNVFSRPSKRDRACPGASARMYVLALAVADLVTSVVVMPSTAYMEHVKFRVSSDFVCKSYQVRRWRNGG